MTTRVALLTPPGRGAIASLAIEGPQATAVVTACFQTRKRTESGALTIGRILVGVWKSPSARETAPASPGEELVICRTGPSRVEVHCHGGHAAVAAILADLCAQGCRHVDSFELAFAADIPLRRAAQIALARATTDRTAGILLDQYNGALTDALVRLADALAAQRCEAAWDCCSTLLRFADLGLHLTTPWRIVVAGPPNVGKSSLINAMVGYQRRSCLTRQGRLVMSCRSRRPSTAGPWN